MEQNKMTSIAIKKSELIALRKALLDKGQTLVGWFREKVAEELRAEREKR